jgi:hypothetical protein
MLSVIIIGAVAATAGADHAVVDAEVLALELADGRLGGAVEPAGDGHDLGRGDPCPRGRGAFLLLLREDIPIVQKGLDRADVVLAVGAGDSDRIGDDQGRDSSAVRWFLPPARGSRPRRRARGRNCRPGGEGTPAVARIFPSTPPGPAA